MTTARKFFSEEIAVPGTTAVSLETLMQTAGWGFEPGTDNAIGTVPSLDSFEANRATFLPAASVYVGHDQYVRDAASSGPPRVYKGVLASSSVEFDLRDYCRGIVDASRVWFYAPGGATTAQLVFEGF